MSEEPSEEKRPTGERPERPERPRKRREAAPAAAEPLPIPVELQPTVERLAGFDAACEMRPDGWLAARVAAERLPDAVAALRETLGYNHLSSVSAVDRGEAGFEVVYHLLALGQKRRLTLSVAAPGGREQPAVPSLAPYWPTANWQEREVYDLMGVAFTGHPDLRRILMREDWEGHPLRKDYVDDRPQRDRVTRASYQQEASS
ncbi:MAG TPA: NADH-quinone oxidoreductase subunit C [Limnochordia bacterium]|nr:NADH-quinone oxidoreductase subunit C [Limnochordia bacterium]